MSDLIGFLTTRLDQDERDAHNHGGPYHIVCCNPPMSAGRVLREVEAKRKILAEHEDTRRGFVIDHGLSELMCVRCADSDRDGEPYAEEPYPCPTLRALAAVYSDHPDYEPAWSLSTVDS